MADLVISVRAAAAIDRWAGWTRGGGQGGCVSPAWRMMQAKMIGIAASGTAPLPEMPDEVLLVDRAVCRLPRALSHPFKVYYLQYAPAEEKARRCGLAHRKRTFYRLVERARARVAAEFDRLAAVAPLRAVTVSPIKRSHCGSLSVAEAAVG